MSASRLVPYKRHDAVIRMGEKLNIPVVIAGTGPEWVSIGALAAAARVPVHLLGHVSNELMRALFQQALAFVFPAVEDFGIIPVEAMASGCPVIVNRAGGAAESVIDGATGFHVDPDDIQEVASALGKVASLDPSVGRTRAAAFDTERFIKEVHSWLPGCASPVRGRG